MAVQRRAGNLAPYYCYLMDRGYATWELFNQIVEVGSSYVCRINDDSAWKVEQTRPLSQEAQQAGVLADVVATLGAYPKTRPRHLVRVVTIKATPHRTQWPPWQCGTEQ